MPEGIEWKGWGRMKARLDKLARGYSGATDHCAAAIGARVLKDAIFKAPTVPYKTGALRGSGTFRVFAPVSWRQVRLQVGFNKHYAAKVHQIPMTFREPSAGNYYLSSKLQRHGREYVESWGRCVHRQLGMA